MRYGRNSKKIKVPGMCEGPKLMGMEFNPDLKKKRRSALGRTRHSENSGPEWEACSEGHARCHLGPKLMNRCKPEKDTKEHGQMLKHILELKKGEVPDREAIG